MKSPTMLELTWKDHLRVLFTPSCWLQNYYYCKEWDQHLRTLVLTHRFEDTEGRYDASIAGLEVWVANHPYGSMTHQLMRPKRATILKTYRIYMKDKFGIQKDRPNLVTA